MTDTNTNTRMDELTIPQLLARLPSAQQRLFVCEAVERLLPKFEARYPDDRRPRWAIEVAALWARGSCTSKVLEAAEYEAWQSATCYPIASPWRNIAVAAKYAATKSIEAAAVSALGYAAKAASLGVLWGAGYAYDEEAIEAARRAALAAEREWQKAKLVELVIEYSE